MSKIPVYTVEVGMEPRIVAVSAGATHTFSKTSQPQIRLLEGLGVEGDAHFGVLDHDQTVG